MKNQKKYSLSFLLLQILLLASAANAFAFSKAALDLGSREGEFFKAESNTKAFIFERNFVDFSLQNQFEKEQDFTSFYSNFFSEFPSSVLLQERKSPSYRERDKKNFLSSLIFPFHFFW